MKMPGGESLLILGLTGSIGMGKTTVADMFKAEGVPVFSSDAAVHQLYHEQKMLILLEDAFPGVVKGGVVDRTALSTYIVGQPENLKKLELLVHPHVRAKEQVFLNDVLMHDGDIVMLDHPLLFETGADKRVDYIIVVSAPEDIQKKRVMARPGMTEEKLNVILAHQMRDEEKRARANFIIDTGKDIKSTRKQVHLLLKQLRSDRKNNNA